MRPMDYEDLNDDIELDGEGWDDEETLELEWDDPESVVRDLGITSAT